MPAITFKVDSVSGSARAGLVVTPHGAVETPTFMPVGTQGTVKCLTPLQVREVGSGIVLANTYHLMLRPGAEIVANAGGLQKWSGWGGPMLTDSGGYQVFSLSELAEISDEGVRFRSHIDGKALFLSPEEAIKIQNQLGADIIMQLDDCVGYPAERYRVNESIRRTADWARRSIDAHSRKDQALFGIVQGSTYKDLRRESALGLADLDLPGYAIGGVSVGEGSALIREVVGATVELLPEEKPRYLMGVGPPVDVLDAVADGIDMFDCVVPTRNGRNGWAFTFKGLVKVKNSVHAAAEDPIEEDCDCYTCRGFSRSYIRHLFKAGEMLGMTLVSLHNLRFYARLMEKARDAIRAGEYEAYRREVSGAFGK